MRPMELFELAKPYLDKNDFGAAHTQRVWNIAGTHFCIPEEIEGLVTTSIILHDIGGSSIKEQYEKGPGIAEGLMRQLYYPDKIIEDTCEIIRTHHEHPEAPSRAFRILYDADQLAKFSKEEFPHYKSRNIDWASVISLMYNEKAKRLAEEMLEKRLKGA